ncbi:MAG: SDR family oxidoreductase [Finegoldia sp.]|nr:SDR family oxidoreductase [Finegoldia sp.]
MKTVLLTGASGGIGEGISKVLQNHHEYRVVLSYNKNSKLVDKLVGEFRAKGIDCISYSCDLTNYEEVKAMFEYIHKSFSKVNILINNAGIGLYKQFQDTTVDEWKKIIDTNINGYYYTSKLALEDMLSLKDGDILNIASIWGLVGASMEVAYATSKAAIIGMTKSLAKEFSYSNIRVNAIAPGAIESPMLYKCHSKESLEYVVEETPLGRLGTPADIANLVEYMISDKNNFMTGQIISPNGGFVIV